MEKKQSNEKDYSLLFSMCVDDDEQNFNGGLSLRFIKELKNEFANY